MEKSLRERTLYKARSSSIKPECKLIVLRLKKKKKERERAK